MDKGSDGQGSENSDILNQKVNTFDFYGVFSPSIF
jgi:hypothetical protein